MSDARLRERKRDSVRDQQHQERQESKLIFLFDTTGEEEEDPGKDHVEVCHTHRYYNESRAQARKDAPPAYPYEYESDEDEWAKYRCNTTDIIKDMLYRIQRMTDDC